MVTQPERECGEPDRGRHNGKERHRGREKERETEIVTLSDRESDIDVMKKFQDVYLLHNCVYMLWSF